MYLKHVQRGKRMEDVVDVALLCQASTIHLADSHLLCTPPPHHHAWGFPPILSVKVVNNIHHTHAHTATFPSAHNAHAFMSAWKWNQTRNTSAVQYIPHLYAKLFGALSSGSCFWEAATPPITAPCSTGRLRPSRLLWPSEDAFITGHVNIAACLEWLLNHIKCFIRAGHIGKIKTRGKVFSGVNCWERSTLVTRRRVDRRSHDARVTEALRVWLTFADQLCLCRQTESRQIKTL